MGELRQGLDPVGWLSVDAPLVALGLYGLAGSV
jgi:hypothetical protein